MPTEKHDLDMLRDYQDFADSVQAKLRSTTHGEEIYAGYAAALLANRERIRRARLTFRVPRPLHRYLAIGQAKSSGGTVEFDLRYLGQSVGQIQVAEGQSPKLTVSETTATNSRRFGYGLGELSQDDWKTGERAAQSLEISGAVADAPECLVLDQVAAGVATRMAVLYLLATRTEGEAR